MNESSKELKFFESSTEQINFEENKAYELFNSVWSQIKSEYGDRMNYPENFFWLNGAPGAGKETQTGFIMDFSNISNPPVVVSSLLKSPEAKKIMDSGLMVGDQEVTHLVFRKLFAPDSHCSMLIDGYPRTSKQALCLKFLFHKLKKIHKNPTFHVIVLFVDEEVSVNRQLKRGHSVLAGNEQVHASGKGKYIEVRKTDIDEQAAQKRYQVFKEVTYEPLKSLRKDFHYHHIDANGSIEEVKERLFDELQKITPST
jgi:adenylate kinase